MPPHLKSALTLLTLTWLSGCAPIPYGESQFNLVAASSSNEWESRISREPGEIQFTTQLEQGSHSHVIFPHANNEHEIPFRIVFSDLDCDTGHEAKLEYRANPNDIYSKYFNTIIPWQTPVQLSIQWDKEGVVSVTLKEETIEFLPHKRFSKVKFRSLSGELPVNHFSYSRLDKEPTNE